MILLVDCIDIVCVALDEVPVKVCESVNVVASAAHRRKLQRISTPVLQPNFSLILLTQEIREASFTDKRRDLSGYSSLFGLYQLAIDTMVFFSFISPPAHPA